MKKLLTIISLLWATVSYADHENDLGTNYYFTQIPALCGTQEVIQNYLNHFGFKPDNISLGREGMNKDGQPVYMVTYYINEDGTQTAATIDIPSGLERCILYHSFDRTTVKE